jgi:hypothetical protein
MRALPLARPPLRPISDKYLETIVLLFTVFNGQPFQLAIGDLKVTPVLRAVCSKALSTAERRPFPLPPRGSNRSSPRSLFGTAFFPTPAEGWTLNFRTCISLDAGLASRAFPSKYQEAIGAY